MNSNAAFPYFWAVHKLRRAIFDNKCLLPSSVILCHKSRLPLKHVTLWNQKILIITIKIHRMVIGLYLAITRVTIKLIYFARNSPRRNLSAELSYADFFRNELM